MGILDAIANRLGFSRAVETKGSPIGGSIGNGMVTGPLDLYGRTRSPSPIDLVRECLNTAYACTSLNADLVASTPLRLYVRTTKRKSKSACISSGRTKKLDHKNRKRLLRSKNVGQAVRTAENVEEVTDHPLLDLLNNPNPNRDDGIGQTAYTLINVTQRYLETVGRAYWYMPKSGPGRTPGAIWCLPAHLVVEQPNLSGDSDRVIDYYQYNGGPNASSRYEVDEIIRFTMTDLLTAGYMGGTSPLRACFESARIFRSYQAQTNALLSNGGMPNGMWTPAPSDVGGAITQEEASRMRSAFRQAFAQAGRGGIFVSEFPGALTPMTWPTNQILDAETYKQVKEDICAAFSVPTTKISRADSTLASAKTGDMSHARDAGLPRLRLMEAALNCLLIPMYDDGGQLFLAFDDPDGLDDNSVELDAAKAMAATLMQVNEGRDLLGLPPLDDAAGEMRYVVGTMAAINADGTRADDEMQPTRKPDPKPMPGGKPGMPGQTTPADPDEQEQPVGPATKSLPDWSVRDARATLARQLGLAPEDDGRPFVGKGFNEDEPRDETGKWTSGGTTLTGWHGSLAKFDQFKVSGGADGESKWGPGVYLTPEREGAEGFITNAPEHRDAYLYETQVKLARPLQGDGTIKPEDFDAINAAAKASGMNGVAEGFRSASARNVYSYLVRNNGYDKAKANAILQAAGFDGVIDSGEFVVFDPAKVKIRNVIDKGPKA